MKSYFPWCFTVISVLKDKTYFRGNYFTLIGLTNQTFPPSCSSIFTFKLFSVVIPYSKISVQQHLCSSLRPSQRKPAEGVAQPSGQGGTCSRRPKDTNCSSVQIHRFQLNGLDPPPPQDFFCHYLFPFSVFS